MAGGVTVVKKATRNVLARLGRKNVHRDRVGANDADPNAKASPLTAVWAIVQAYALVALVLTVYNSIFAGDGRVPDDVQVLLEPEPEPSRLASAVARPRALPFSTHRWRKKKMQVTRVTTRERALTILPLFPSPRDQETHDSIGYLKQLLRRRRPRGHA